MPKWRRRPRWSVLGVLFVVALSNATCGRSGSTGRRVIVLGFDGMDYELTRRFMAEGKLPNLQRLAESGGFSPLTTSIPPQSPVAWSEFITGMDAGGHGIYDFMHRDTITMVPYLSTSRSSDPSRTIKLGRWQLPLSGGTVELLRHGTPFWEVLEENGIPTTVMRMPANFPPSGTASRELSGMGTPDLLGTYGTFSFFTTVPERITEDVSGGVVYRAELVDNVLDATLVGPPNPFLIAGDSVRAEFKVYADPTRPVAKIVIDDQEIILQEGEWSEWVTVDFTLLPYVQSLRGIVRFYLKQVHPEFELYVTPINIDPLNPAMPISTPSGFAAELARGTGRFYSQGMPEETSALSSGVFDNEDFLRQATLVAEENRRQYRHVLEHFDDGFLFYYFGNLDLVSHMMWRTMDSTHPAHDPVADAPYRNVIEELYVEADEIVGETLQSMDDDATLIVMSDHGFTSWTRAFNLNSWLRANGYIAFKNRSDQVGTGFFENVDWSRTQAYAIGFNSVYINLRGRERVGSVPRQQRRLVLDEIARNLVRFIDPKTGKPAVTKVYKRDQVFEDRGHLDIGPDLIVGFARGVRGSDESALGTITREIITDNTGKWSGDHLMDHEAVPGVLFTNRPLQRAASSLKELGAAVLAEFGIEGFPSAGN
ncbi:MAG: alkaline phosphatase family protein [Gemmatimonadetes bacterium]|nr:alkaline phosphatase family protein [Gemmatimonadota bacterium]